MKGRIGEKLGWIGGWLGAFSWFLVFSIILLIKGDYSLGFAGIILFIVAVFLINVMSPWRQPEVKYWILFTPLYTVFAAAIVIAFWSLAEQTRRSVNWWTFLGLVCVFLPYFILGQTTWNKGQNTNEK